MNATAQEQTSLDRQAVGAVILGNALEFYDFTTYSFFAKQIGEAYFPSDNPGASLLSSLLVFWIGFFTRPIGGVVIGAYADRAGRKPAMLLTIALMAIGMLLLAATPRFSTIGWFAPALVISGRLIQGFALGGEVGPTTAYLLEAAPSDQRGLFTSWQLASQGLAQIFAGLLGFALAVILSDAAMKSWGWRVPFLAGIAIVPIGLIIRNQLPETAGASAGKAAAGSVSGVLSLLVREHRRPLILGGFVIMSGTIATYVGLNMPTYATATLGLSLKVSTGATLVLGITTLVFSLAGGWLADRYGRRPVMIFPRAVIVVAAIPAFLWLVRQPVPLVVYAVTIMLSTLTAITSTGSIIAIPESLPRNVRSAGIAIIYALSVSIFGGSTQWIINKLILTTGDKLAPAYYLAAVSVIGTIAGFLMHETKGRDLD